MKDKFKYVFVVGCSYSYGEGLNYVTNYNKTGVWKNANDSIRVNERDEEYREKWRYSKLLADKFGAQEINEASNGTSMDRSWRLITDFIFTDERAKDSLIVWQLTILDRREVYRNEPHSRYAAYPPSKEESINIYLKYEKKWIDSHDKYYVHPTIRFVDYLKKILMLDSYCKLNDIGLSVFDGLMGIEGLYETHYDFEPDSDENSISSSEMIDTFRSKKILTPINGRVSLGEAQEDMYKKDNKIVDGAYACAELNDEGNFKDGHPGKDCMIAISDSIYNSINEGD